MILYTAAAVLGFMATLPGDAFFWMVDTVQMMQKEEVCRPADQTLRDYLVKGYWTEAPWRPACKEE
ncbi:hypothetical protein [Nitrospira sp. Kam-Ns4a]